MMDELSKLHSAIACSRTGQHQEAGLTMINNTCHDTNNLAVHHQLEAVNVDHHNHNINKSSTNMSDLVKVQIANHPLYPNLLSAYLQCRKVNLTGDFMYFLLFIYIWNSISNLGKLYEGWSTARNDINSRRNQQREQLNIQLSQY